LKLPAKISLRAKEEEPRRQKTIFEKALPLRGKLATKQTLPPPVQVSIVKKKKKICRAKTCAESLSEIS
jgi:hypothetical protein